eukprot:TRINITY_DN53_c0_g1_i1.p1 TRINITY_DN53_c0_g1~~TRINITY_DN53_c0_g1_i1.p1  ORF type:complete len:393 (+),score=42.17 TRINITY_DN53_c0_g1_i1:64-1242(+)
MNVHEHRFKACRLYKGGPCCRCGVYIYPFSKEVYCLDCVEYAHIRCIQCPLPQQMDEPGRDHDVTLIPPLGPTLEENPQREPMEGATSALSVSSVRTGDETFIWTDWTALESALHLEATQPQGAPILLEIDDTLFSSPYLPSDIWTKICSFLPRSSIGRLSQVSKSMQRHSQHDAIWLELIERRGLMDYYVPGIKDVKSFYKYQFCIQTCAYCSADYLNYRQTEPNCRGHRGDFVWESTAEGIYQKWYCCESKGECAFRYYHVPRIAQGGQVIKTLQKVLAVGKSVMAPSNLACITVPVEIASGVVIDSILFEEDGQLCPSLGVIFGSIALGLFPFVAMGELAYGMGTFALSPFIIWDRHKNPVAPYQQQHLLLDKLQKMYTRMRQFQIEGY